MSDAERTDDDLYDTVIGYRGGNWIYEWATQAMVANKKPVRKKIRNSAVDTGCMRLRTLYNIAAYPHPPPPPPPPPPQRR